jgi:non-canonical purine NTP pyrophosphatase (RdgB/HAM1 family)
MIVYCATSNPGKLREFQRAAADFEVRPLAVQVEPPEETGHTFEENAVLKAEYYSRFADGPLFADDSGLEVDALGGEPGVHSARYAGPDATDARNNALLLERLKGVENRTARFVCVIALAEKGKLIRTFRGSVEGRILHELRGNGGFGYDPLFFHEPFGRTFGEAPLGDKMLVSHRAQALGAMFDFLRAQRFMRQAIQQAIENVSSGRGGPFATLVVKDGRVIGSGTNEVTSRNDPTAHAEVVAIREACQVLGSFQLEGCDIYSTCEPCPMCFGAVYWARPRRLFFAATAQDAADAGFDDRFIYAQIAEEPGKRAIPFMQVMREEALECLRLWVRKPDKVPY